MQLKETPLGTPYLFPFFHYFQFNPIRILFQSFKTQLALRSDLTSVLSVVALLRGVRSKAKAEVPTCRDEEESEEGRNLQIHLF